MERRFDSRQEQINLKKKLGIWLQSFSHPRLGVDRRKKINRRKTGDRRLQLPGSILTPEELADLLL